jgi:hypothetical protein
MDTMRYSLLLSVILIAITACAPQVDRCTADPNLPDYRANQAVAQSTIAAANADTDARVRQAYMKGHARRGRAARPGHAGRD